MSAATDIDRHEIKRLIALMRDPRYWRDHDPRVEQDVRTGFRRLCGKPDPAMERGQAMERAG